MKHLVGCISLFFTFNSMYAQEWIQTTDFNRQLAISSSGLFGYTEYVWGRDIKDSRVIVPFQFTWAETFDKAGHAVVQLKGKTGMIDTLGRFVIPADYDNVFSFSNGYAKVFREGKFGAVNSKGELVIPTEYDFLSDFTKGGRADAVKGNKWGVIDTKNKVIFPFEYLLTRTDDKNFSRVFLKDWGFIDAAGKPVFDNTYQALSHEANGLIIAYLTSGKSLLMNSRYETLIPSGLQYKMLNNKGTHVIVEREGKQGLYDLATKKLVLPVEFESLSFNGDIVAATKSFQTGPAWFADLNGSKLFGKEFTRILPFTDYTGFAEVSVNNKWGLIDLKGNLILPIVMGTEKESNIYVDMNTGRISARKGSLWGMTDLKGNIQLPYQYTDQLGGSSNPFYFTGELKVGVVKDYNINKKGIVNNKGSWVFKPGESYYDDFGIINQFVEGDGVYVPVLKKGKWGVYDLISKKEIIAPKLANFGSAEYAHATFLDDKENWGLIHYGSGKMYKAGQYEYTDFDDETNLLTVKKNSGMGLADPSEKLVAPAVYDALSYDSEGNAYFAIKNGKAGFIDTKGKTIIPFKYDPLPMLQPNDWVNGHVRMIEKGMSVMLNSNGKTVATSSQFKGPVDMFIVRTRFAGSTFCFMGKFDENDKEVVRILLNGKLYEDIGGDLYNHESSSSIVFSEGLLAAKRNGFYGYLDHNGNEVIPFAYERASPFTDGVAYVKKDGKYFIINRDGKKMAHYDMKLALASRFK